MKKRKICIITGTRSEYGLLKLLMTKIKSSPVLELSIIATGMHLSHEFGNTYRDIEKDGFKMDAKVDMLLSADSSGVMPKSIGIGIYGITQALENIKPEIVVILGDRVEAFAGAVSSAGLNIAVVHIHGGDKAMGGLDDFMRHAITKFAHLHFAATEKSKERIIKMGENSKYVFKVGAPGLDTILSTKFYTKAQLEKILSTTIDTPTILLVQHSVSTEPEKSSFQMQETMEAIKQLEIKTIVIYPNSDSGGRAMIDVIQSYSNLPFISIYKSLDRIIYLNLLKYVSLLAGNSSSGIIEAASFNLPVVNIGIRQKDRERSTNVIDVSHDKKKILAAVKKALYNDQFRTEAKNCKNIYGDGRASERIIKILERIDISRQLLQKQITY